MRTSAKFSMLILGSTLLGGCASTSEPERIAPGSVALVAAHYAPQAEFNAYAHGTGANVLTQAGKTAARGAGFGGIGPAYVARALGPFGLLLLPVIVAGAAVGGVVGAVGGAIDGAANAMPSNLSTG